MDNDGSIACLSDLGVLVQIGQYPVGVLRKFLVETLPKVIDETVGLDYFNDELALNGIYFAVQISDVGLKLIPKGVRCPLNLTSKDASRLLNLTSKAISRLLNLASEDSSRLLQVGLRGGPASIPGRHEGMLPV